MNRVVMVGRIVKDPEVKKTQSNKTVANFTVAINDKYSKDKTDFINCVAWEKTADYLGNYVKKGNLIAVEGRISTRNYDGSDGKKVYITEVVCESVQGLERNDQTQTTSNHEQPRATPSNPKPWQTFTPEPTEEDLPF
jgi:single-strand DNA-binding protein